LKGYTVGGAQVSHKHAGFIVNSGGATAKDLQELIKHIKSIVHERHGITLREEIKYIE
jgi:UDP-N-acetylmuramate dehydrogenase